MPLHDNFLFGKRSARRHYLLRRLIKCGLCGLACVGVGNVRPNEWRFGSCLRN